MVPCTLSTAPCTPLLTALKNVRRYHTIKQRKERKNTNYLALACERKTVYSTTKVDSLIEAEVDSAIPTVLSSRGKQTRRIKQVGRFGKPVKLCRLLASKVKLWIGTIIK